MDSKDNSITDLEVDKDSNSRRKRNLLITLLLVSVIVFAFSVSRNLSEKPYIPEIIKPEGDTIKVSKDQYGLNKFSSEEEYREFFINADGNKFMAVDPGFNTVVEFDTMMMEGETRAPAMGLPQETTTTGSKAEYPSYVSSTNVQVLGIDEPDILKTDGKNIYYYRERVYSAIPMNSPDPTNQPPIETMEESLNQVNEKPESIPPPMEYPQYIDQIEVLSAYPPETLSKASSIDDSGEMFYVNGKLLVLGDKKISAYNVKNPKLPVMEWDMDYDDNVSLVDSRLFGNEMFIVLARNNRSPVCPVPMYTLEGNTVTLDCIDIYRPNVTRYGDTVYSVLKIDTDSGKVINKVSFAGKAEGTVVYMSNENLYVAYNHYLSYSEILLNLITSNTTDIFPEYVVENLRRIKGYDISDRAKELEIQTIINTYLFSLDNDEQKRFETEMQNKLEQYMRENYKNFTNTGIFKLGRKNLDFDAYGFFPGDLLNQFSMDEYNENLRVAVTFGGIRGMGLSDISPENSNGIYVLDDNLKIIGEVMDMGVTERIYSARFVQDRAYLVTFRQIDPFYVVDMSNPRKPEVKGELKIPGYSSYLHPLDKDLILGVGKDGSRVKVSLFNVSNPTNPVEVDVYNLDEYTSDILQTHHAFTHDPRKDVFFIPAGNGGYIFAYTQNSLSLVKAIDENNVRRSLVLDDYLYILTNEKVVVLSENNWERVNEIKL